MAVVKNKHLRERMASAAKREKEKLSESDDLIAPISTTPFEYICPITRMIMDEPVKTNDNHIYEKRAIIRWYLESPHKTSPLINSIHLSNPSKLPIDTSLQKKLKNILKTVRFSVL